jgi:Fur family zinc uptake transcriptional regulator
MSGAVAPSAERARLTRNQALVLAALDAAEAPLGAYALLDRLRDQGLRAPTQVYRALDKLLALGLAHRLESLNAFVACRHHHDAPAAEGPESGPAVFVICDGCGRTLELTDPIVGGRLERLARDKGFGLHASNIELRGLCAACAEGTGPG